MKAAALLGTLFLTAVGATGADVQAGKLLISEAWARPTPPGISVGAVYLRITNRGNTADRLVGASSPLAAQVEIHETREQAGVMEMRKIPALACPPGATVSISPGGVHLMLVGLKQPWPVGAEVPLTLTFQSAGSVTLAVPVQAKE